MEEYQFGCFDSVLQSVGVVVSQDFMQIDNVFSFRLLNITCFPDNNKSHVETVIYFFKQNNNSEQYSSNLYTDSISNKICSQFELHHNYPNVD